MITLAFIIFPFGILLGILAFWLAFYIVETIGSAIQHAAERFFGLQPDPPPVTGPPRPVFRPLPKGRRPRRWHRPIRRK